MISADEEKKEAFMFGGILQDTSQVLYT